jgi:hypothetical protein
MYVFLGGSLQALLYLLLSISRNHDWLIYFDPRIGTFFLETGWRGTEQVVPGVVRWLTAGWLIMIGALLLSGRKLIWAYIISEIILLLPNIVFFVVIVLANLRPAHGFSVGELFVPIIVVVAFSIVPLVLAFRARRQPPNLDSRNAVRA